MEVDVAASLGVDDVPGYFEVMNVIIAARRSVSEPAADNSHLTSDWTSVLMLYIARCWIIWEHLPLDVFVKVICELSLLGDVTG